MIHTRQIQVPIYSYIPTYYNMYTISTWFRRSKKSNNDNDSLSIYRWVFVLLFNTFGCTKKKKKINILKHVFVLIIAHDVRQK